ncbi:penicillin-binding protein activator [Hafnia paralvei]|uniref:penicillin-binding protein activator n=1 Tax=Hafnia paralvei TaxID=546367 RepID=UPI001419176F|nr:penicillin-binding protein activator [Hafnia paralvei]NIH32402.1 penicillin-binding protein activator [Hafnia paralvei]
MLSSLIVRTKSGRIIPVVLAAMLMAGCPGRAPQTPAADIQAEATSSSEYYLQQMQQSSDDNKADWQLLAIRALIREGKLPQAAELLGKLPQELTDVQRQEQQLVSAELYIAQKNMPNASAILYKLNIDSLSDSQKARYYQAVIDASQGKASLPVIRAYIAQEPLLNDKQRVQNINGTWAALTQLTQADLNSLVINADENILQGWLDLLRLYQDNKQDPSLLKAAIKDWQTRYPNNPASKVLPTALDNVLNFKQASTSNVALLLPMNGQAQVFANAIQAGFNAAKNGAITQSAPTQPQPAAAPSDANATQPTTTDPNANGAVSTSGAQPAAETAPTAQADADGMPIAPIVPPSASNAQIKVYDTSSQPLPALLAQAKQDGATLVVGPLLKENVDQLSTTSTPLNVLALNQPEQVQNNPNICYFALSPENEARDAAKHIWEQGKRSPLILAPRGSLGDRVAKAFAQEWQQLGGSTVLQQGFGSTGELRQAINGGSGIRMTGQPVSVAAASQPQSVTIAGLTIPAPPADAGAVSTSSGNVDAVYIIATPAELTLIKPMIDLANGSRNGLGLYASSRSYQAGSGPDFRLEMDGLQFSDIPLLAGGNPALLQQAASQFKNDYSLVRLYAMGADAWVLANHFSQMRQIGGFQLNGSTGVLSADSNCVINRKLPWLQYRSGTIVPMQ